MKPNATTPAQPEQDQQPNTTEQLMEHSMALNHEQGQMHSQLLEHTLQTVGEQGKTHELLLQHNLEMHGDTQKRLDDIEKLLNLILTRLPEPEPPEAPEAATG